MNKKASKKIEIFIDGKKLTKEQALSEAKNHFGVGNGVDLLAIQLVGNRYVSVDEDLYQDNKKEYIRNAIARGIYDIFLMGSALLEHIEEHPDFPYYLMSLLDTKPHSEIVGGNWRGDTEKERLLNSIEDIEICNKLVEDVADILQCLVEVTGMDGSFEHSKNNALRFDIGE